MATCRVILQEIEPRRLLFGGQLRKRIVLDNYCITNAEWPSNSGVDPEPIIFWDDSSFWDDNLIWSDE